LQQASNGAPKLRTEVDIIEPAPLGTESNFPKDVQREFLMATKDLSYSGPDDGKGRTALRSILQAANKAILDGNLNAEGIFALIGPCFKGEALEDLVSYQKSGKFAAFSKYLQLTAMKGMSASEITRRLTRLIQTRPTGHPGKILNEIIHCHRDLVSNMDPVDRESSFNSGARHSLEMFVSSWFPHQLSAVRETFARLEGDHKNRVLLARSARDPKADSIAAEFCPVQAFLQSVIENCSHVDAVASSNDKPRPQQNPQGPQGQQNQKPPNFRNVNLTQGFPAQPQQHQPWSQPQMYAQQFSPQNLGSNPRFRQVPPSMQPPVQRFMMDPNSQFSPQGPYHQPMQYEVAVGGAASPENPWCRRCNQHRVYGKQGLVNPCYRYPSQDQGEENAVCSACGLNHFSYKCVAHIPPPPP
jgi:hypothetical protein